MSSERTASIIKKLQWMGTSGIAVERLWVGDGSIGEEDEEGKLGNNNWTCRRRTKESVGQGWLMELMGLAVIKGSRCRHIVVLVICDNMLVCVEDVAGEESALL